MSMRNRREERFDFNLHAKISVAESDGRESFESRTRDISSTGGFFEIDQPLEVGAEVQIELVLSLEKLKKMQGKHARIKVSGMVVRTDAKGVAVCFDENYEISPLEDAEPGQPD